MTFYLSASNHRLSGMLTLMRHSAGCVPSQSSDRASHHGGPRPTWLVVAAMLAFLPTNLRER